MGKSGLRQPAAILHGLKLARGRFSGADVAAQFWRRAKNVVFARVPRPLAAASGLAGERGRAVLEQLRLDPFPDPARIRHAGVLAE